MTTDVIRFGGGEDGDGGAARPTDTPAVDLDACHAFTFYRTFTSWIYRVWVHRESGPQDAEGLSRFDEFTLVDDFRRGYARGDWRDLRRGTTVEEVWLGFQLGLRTPARCLVNKANADQPLGRISRKSLLGAKDFVASLRRWMATPGAACHALVLTRRTSGHSIMLYGIDPESGSFRIFDPWPVRSLLCAENNEVGAAATPDPVHPGLWLLSPEDLERVLVAVVVREETWRAWQGRDEFALLWPVAQALAAGASAEEAIQAQASQPPQAGQPGDVPELPWLAAPPAPASAAERAFSAGVNWVSAEGSNRAAVAFAALHFGVLLETRGHRGEAAHWYRQAAMIGEPDAIRRLTRILADRDPREADYWVRRAAEGGTEGVSADVAEVERRWLASDQRFVSAQQKADWEVGGGGAALREAAELDRDGDADRASDAYRSLLASRDLEVAPRAANSLGILLERAGDIGKALATYAVAASSDHFTFSAYGSANLGRLLRETGEVDMSRVAERRAVESGHYEVAAKVALSLARDLWRAGEVAEARQCFERAVYSNDADASTQAAFALGVLLQTALDDRAGAAEMYRRATTASDPETASMAQQALDLLGETPDGRHSEEEHLPSAEG